MVAKDRVPLSADKSAPSEGVWQQGSEAANALQKDLLEACEEASRAWLARVESELGLWSELASKLTAARSVPEVMEAYAKSVSQRMQMTADDARRLFDDCQKVTQKITQSLSKGWPSGST